MKKNLFLNCISILLFTFCSTNCFSQDLKNESKLWLGRGVKYKISNQFRIKYNSMYATNLSSSGFSFAQGTLGLTYKIKRKLYVEGGYKKMLVNNSRRKREKYNLKPTLFNKLAFNRIYVNGSFKHDIDLLDVNGLTMTHKVQLEHYLPGVVKHSLRSYYSNRISYRVKESSIKLKPYIKNNFYHYAGGEIGSGFKNHRIRLGVSARPIEKWPITTSAYFMKQNEYKTEPRSPNDYNVIGLGLYFNFK